MKLNVALTLETLGIVALLMLSTAATPLAAATAAPLVKDDFKASSFAKVVDLFDFARAQATAQGLTPPSSSLHAYVYTVWINSSGIQLFYTGMVNYTDGIHPAFTVPIQSFLEHFKSQQGKDVLVASAFLSLLSFQEGSNTIYANSPDINDTIYASFSLGTTIPALTNQPRQNNTATITQLSQPDSNTWTWGMTYKDLTAVWWRITPDPAYPAWEGFHPVAVTTYNELTFNYKLTLDPTSKTATLSESFVVGEMTNLWYIDYSTLIPKAIHYNDTGNYYLNGTQRGPQTIHQFASAQDFKLSIVLFQSSIVVSHKEENEDSIGNATDKEHNVSKDAITTKADDNETLYKTNFGTKSTYQLYNSTSLQTSQHDAVTRTVRIHGYSANPAFGVQTFFLKIEVYAILVFHPGIWANHDDLDISRANFVYIISYPTWGGYKVVHDPTYTAYYTPEAPGFSGVFLAAIGVAVVAILGGAVLFSRRRHVNLPAAPATIQ